MFDNLPKMKRKKEYSKARGVRIPDGLWAKLKRESKARNQRPSDFIRAAASAAINNGRAA